MKHSVPVLLAILIAACGSGPATPEREAATASSALPMPVVVSPARVVPATAFGAPSDDLNVIPPAACEPDNYVQFVNAFAQFGAQRPRFVTDAGRAQLGGFDITLVDHRWQRESDDVALEVEISRAGTRLDVTSTPVERDVDDSPVRTLGPTSRHAFEHRAGCWRYAGRR